MSDDDCNNSERPVVLVHSSDLHIDDDIESNKYHGLEGLRYVLKAAADVRADLVMLAGDTFDNGRVATEVAQQAGEIIAKATMPIVLLPGNHDPALPDGIFHRSGILGLDQAMVIGHTHAESIVLKHLNLEIIGRPHRSYYDMPPLLPPMPRKARWQVIMAHGHFVQPSDWEDESHRSWLISEAELGATGADYVALGHWDRPVAVGDGRVPAYYSGAPDLAETVNVIRLDHQTGVTVERRHLGMPFPRRW